MFLVFSSASNSQPYPQTDVFEPNLGLWDSNPDELSTFEEMWSPGLQQWDSHFAPDVEPAIESALGGLLGNGTTCGRSDP